MTESEAYLAFNLAEGIGFSTVEALAREAGSVAKAWSDYPKKISRTGGPVDLEGELKLARRFGVAILTPADPLYPRALREVPGRPLALYVKGDVQALAKPAVALIGTRRATAYGREQANRLAYDLAQAGWSIVSGLALGIDGEAHRGALAAEGTTVGVIGSGLDRFYPEENRDLAREIVRKGGAVVSEFPFGRAPDRETFPIRNHVVAGLSRAVLAIEAPVKSGTLITASIAADLGRTVMAIPGRVDAPSSAGCLKLLREGAVLVRSADDVMEALADFFPPQMKGQPKPPPSAAPACDPSAAPDPDAPPYSVEEALVMLHVTETGVSMDDLVRLTKLPVSRVNSLAMTLRLKGFVRFLPGNRLALTRATRPRAKTEEFPG